MASRCALEKDHRIARMSKRLELYRFKGIVMVLLEVAVGCLACTMRQIVSLFGEIPLDSNMPAGFTHLSSMTKGDCRINYLSIILQCVGVGMGMGMGMGMGVGVGMGMGMGIFGAVVDCTTLCHLPKELQGHYSTTYCKEIVWVYEMLDPLWENTFREL